MSENIPGTNWEASIFQRKSLEVLLKEVDVACEGDDSPITPGEQAIVLAVAAAALMLQVTIVEAVGGTVEEVKDE